MEKSRLAQWKRGLFYSGFGGKVNALWYRTMRVTLSNAGISGPLMVSCFFNFFITHRRNQDFVLERFASPASCLAFFSLEFFRYNIVKKSEIADRKIIVFLYSEQIFRTRGLQYSTSVVSTLWILNLQNKIKTARFLCEFINNFVRWDGDITMRIPSLVFSCRFEFNPINDPEWRAPVYSRFLKRNKLSRQLLM